MFYVYIELLSSPLFWIITFLSIWIAIMPDIVAIIIANLKRVQQDPTYKYSSNVSTKNSVLLVRRYPKYNLGQYFWPYNINTTLTVKMFPSQLCCIQTKKKWTKSVRAQLNKKSGRVSMMRSTKYRSPLPPLQLNNVQGSPATDIASRESLTAESSTVEV